MIRRSGANFLISLAVEIYEKGLIVSRRGVLSIFIATSSLVTY